MLGVMLLAGCTGTAQDGAGGSADPLPTGLVGPVAPTVGPGALRYVALGDSYTFGDGVNQADRWPNQLARILRPDLDLDIVANLAGRSTASRDLIEDQLPRLGQLDPQFVTVQVGANDWFFSSPENYRANIDEILDSVLREGVPADRIIVLTTPDFTLIPAQLVGLDDPAETSAILEQFNILLRDAAEVRGIAVVDISPISDRVTMDPSLVAPDGLHPSGKQYAGWADMVAATVRDLYAGAPTASPAAARALASSVPRASVAP